MGYFEIHISFTRPEASLHTYEIRKVHKFVCKRNVIQFIYDDSTCVTYNAKDVVIRSIAFREEDN